MKEQPMTETVTPQQGQYFNYEFYERPAIHQHKVEQDRTPWTFTPPYQNRSEYLNYKFFSKYKVKYNPTQHLHDLWTVNILSYMLFGTWWGVGWGVDTRTKIYNGVRAGKFSPQELELIRAFYEINEYEKEHLVEICPRLETNVVLDYAQMKPYLYKPELF